MQLAIIANRHSTIGMVRKGCLKIRALRRGAGVAALIFLGLLILVPLGAGAIAQESLPEQMKRIRRDLEDIQSYLYRSTNLPPSKSVTAPVESNPESTALLQRQVLEMQTQMRELTGQLEQIDHGMRLMGTRLDKLVGDVDLRLQALEAGGTATAARPSANGSVAGRAAAPPQTVVRRDDKGTTIISSRTPAGAQRPLDPNLLGRVRQQDVDAVRLGQKPRSTAVASNPRATFREAPAPQSAPGPASVTAGGVQQRAAAPRILPEGTIQEQYTFAFKLLRKRDYATAETALREFIEWHPDVPLAGNAMYWMGETYYVRKDYAEAARIFLDAYQRFPKGNKAADNLFKLAKSLAQIGEKESACTTYGKLLKSFPAANARILSSTRNDMNRLACS